LAVSELTFKIRWKNMICKTTFPFLLCVLLAINLHIGVNADAEEENEWEDSEVTTELWRMIRDHNTHGLYGLIQQTRDVIHLRSADGRGPLFWAYEYGHDEAIKLLLDLGVDAEVQDTNGIKPSDIERVTPPPKQEAEEYEDGEYEEEYEEEYEDDDYEE